MIESPCIRHCCLDENDVCMGCHRTLGEIKEWGVTDSETRRAILNNAEQRKSHVQIAQHLVR